MAYTYYIIETSMRQQKNIDIGLRVTYNSLRVNKKGDEHMKITAQDKICTNEMIRLLEKMDKSTQVYLMGYSQGLMERVCIPSMSDMTKSEKK